MVEEETLVYWCDMMVKTYNTSILDNFPTSLKRSLQEEAQQCVESKPNPNYQRSVFGLIKTKKRRNVLMRLINNYFRSKQIQTFPTVDFIGGPHTLTLHWSDKYNKIIYIFGEIHREKVCDYENMMLVEDYIRRLFRVSSAFIDFFLEISMFIKDKYTYKFSHDSTTDFRLQNLQEQNIKCIESSQRQENRECDNRRVHFIDIRQGVETEKERRLITMNSSVIFEIYAVKLMEFIPTQDEETILFYGDDSQLNVVKMIKYKSQIIGDINYIFRSDDVKPLLDFILFGTKETYEDFWKKEIEAHEFIKHELSKSTDETKIREFAEEEFKKISDNFIDSILMLREYFTSYYDETSGYCDFYKLLNPDLVGDYIDFFSFFVEFSEQLMIFNAILVDVYTLARMFKKFQLNHTRKSGTTRKTDEPEEPHNIIIYAGDRHSRNIRRFLDEKLGFELISESKGDRDVDFCVDIRHFEQPFFSSWPPKKMPQIERKPTKKTKRVKRRKRHALIQEALQRVEKY